MSEVKTVRLSQRVQDLLETRQVNFSQLANEAIERKLMSKVWIPNYDIHEYAGITPQVLNKNIRNVRQLRCKHDVLKFFFFPYGERELSANKAIHDYVNGNANTIHDNYVYFNLEFPVDFYFFLRSNSWVNVEMCIIGYICAQFLLGDEKDRVDIESWLEPKILKRMIKAYDKDFKPLESEWRVMEEQESPGSPRINNFNQIYLNTLLGYNIQPIMFPYFTRILFPIQYPFYIKSYTGSVDLPYEYLTINSAYMRNIYEEKDDWQSIAVLGNEKKDDLVRAESKETPFIDWSYKYQTHHGLNS